MTDYPTHEFTAVDPELGTVTVEPIPKTWPLDPHLPVAVSSLPEDNVLADLLAEARKQTVLLEEILRETRIASDAARGIAWARR